MRDSLKGQGIVRVLDTIRDTILDTTVGSRSVIQEKE